MRTGASHLTRNSKSLTILEVDISIKQPAYARKIFKGSWNARSQRGQSFQMVIQETRLMKTAEGPWDYLVVLCKNQRKLSYEGIKKVLRYVKGTKDYGITYKHNGGNRIYGIATAARSQHSRRKRNYRINILLMENHQLAGSTQKKPLVELYILVSEFIASSANSSKRRKMYVKALIEESSLSGRASTLIRKPLHQENAFERERPSRLEFVAELSGKADILTKGTFRRSDF
ncbi:hypothetical protein Tco_1266153 [Tanacetum coccineum]